MPDGRTDKPVAKNSGSKVVSKNKRSTGLKKLHVAHEYAAASSSRCLCTYLKKRDAPAISRNILPPSDLWFCNFERLR